MLIPALLDDESTLFPDPNHALKEPNGLLAIGGDLRSERLLSAYKHGIFPWFTEDQPILWWSPDPRVILFPKDIHISHSLKKLLKKNLYPITIDTAFQKVIDGCGDLRAKEEGTWITPEMKAAYNALYLEGYAHSIEVWKDKELIGGLYGVAIGAAFFAESMFSLQPNASKIALATLAKQLQQWNFHIIDCQLYTPHLASMGAAEISRMEYLRRLKIAVTSQPAMQRWALTYEWKDQ